MFNKFLAVIYLGGTYFLGLNAARIFFDGEKYYEMLVALPICLIATHFAIRGIKLLREDKCTE